MEYKLQIGREELSAEIIDEQERRLRLRLDGIGYEIEYEILSDNWYHLALNREGRSVRLNAFVLDDPDGKTVVINGRSYTVQDTDQLVRRVQKNGSPQQPDRITPPMPAVVVAVPVSKGQRVKKGQAVMVVSAMKMETTLCAPFDGTVVKINAAVNDKVSPGQLLVEIQQEENVPESR
ncbi:MAG: biotin/lipoyl-containing protein [Thermodesulfobacteriota bacterium]